MSEEQAIPETPTPWRRPASEPIRTGVERVDAVVDAVAGLERSAGRRARGGLRDAPTRSSRRRSTHRPTTRPHRRRTLRMPPRRLRLDAELVRRGLARSREHASELIAAGRVKVSRAPWPRKPATGVTTDVAIVVADDPDRPDYVSRGGHKLAGALEAFEPHGLEVAGRRCLDAGASTGGFTDVLLRRGRGRGGRGRRRLRPAGLAAAQRRPGGRARPHNVRELTRGADRRAGRPRRRRPVVHLAARWCSTRWSA